jgi:hypothetical protein
MSRLVLAALFLVCLRPVRPAGREPGICRECGAFGGAPPNGCGTCGQVW